MKISHIATITNFIRLCKISAFRDFFGGLGAPQEFNQIHKYFACRLPYIVHNFCTPCQSGNANFIFSLRPNVYPTGLEVGSADLHASVLSDALLGPVFKQCYAYINFSFNPLEII